MKALLWLFATIAAALLWAGCAAMPQPHDEKHDNVIAEAGQKATAMLDAFIANDEKSFESFLSAEMQKSFTVSEFKASRLALTDSLGTPKSAAYLSQLQNPVFTILLYKVNFEKVTSENQTIEQQALFRCVYAKIDGQLQLISFGFI